MAVTELRGLNKPFLFGKVHAKMPLAYCMGGVPASFEELGHSFSVFINKGRRKPTQHIALQL